MINRYTTFIKAINLTFDYFVLNISMLIAYAIEQDGRILWLKNQSYMQIVVVFNLVWLLSSNLTGLNKHVLYKDSLKTFKHAIKTYLLYVGLICTINIMVGTQSYFISRGYIFYSSVLFGLLLCTWKLIFLSIRKSKRNTLFDSRKVVIVGYGRNGVDLHDFFKNDRERDYKLLGFFDDNPEIVEDKESYLGTTDDCMNYIRNNKVDEIFCTLRTTETEKIERLLIDSDKHLIRFRFVPEYYNFGIKPLLYQSFGHIPVISARAEPQENVLNRFIKRVFDIGFSLFIIFFILSWAYPLLAILIKMESKGPVFFKQLRSGRDNRPFMCYKFRSMAVNDESDKKQATRNDPRITKLGAFMRRTSIDELPQFFNVLIGNMSTVGPRPHMLNHTEQYSKLIDGYMVRHFLKPGITGQAQVQGLRGETRSVDDMLKRVEADVWYLENWSFLLDLQIIFNTIWNSVKDSKTAF